MSSCPQGLGTFLISRRLLPWAPPLSQSVLYESSDEPLDLGSFGSLKGFFRDHRRLSRIDRRQALLDVGDRDRRYRKLSDSQTDQRDQPERIGGHFSADGNRTSQSSSRVHDALYHSKDCR